MIHWRRAFILGFGGFAGRVETVPTNTTSPLPERSRLPVNLFGFGFSGLFFASKLLWGWCESFGGGIFPKVLMFVSNVVVAVVLVSRWGGGGWVVSRTTTTPPLW